MHLKDNRLILTCAQCGTAVRRYPSHVRGSGIVFCSRSCQYTPPELLPNPDDPSSMLVPLQDGTFAFIDAEDAERVGQFTWTRSGNGYVQKTSRIPIYLHRFVMDAPPDKDVDHRFGNLRDCRKRMLRFSEPSGFCGNAMNKGVTRASKSGYKGVFWDKARGKWLVQIQAAGRVYSVGRFDDKEEAARAYDAAARIHHGEFARLNFSDDA